ncbi:MAG: ImmA/IrrE family metallo-endopeptidase [Desulfosarcina sp.]|nr:ImmA/IrrE family metallo-endopeptidase [Desulfosarcina sp.]MBC2742854.1 ImmA/IrrE family metallo-endopeptidase [Desulfosarcina sp.]MBC2765764.1 ImmA/IrrE family metallo-endopeptidase [Desulfosarcina sp.]
MSRRIVPAKPRKKIEIDHLAISVVKAIQPSALSKAERFEIERFFDCYLEEITGVKTDYRALDDGIYGFTDSDRMECVISCELAEDATSEYFCRSTMAHEVGHAIMHVMDYRLKKALLRSIHRKDHQLRVYREKEIKIYKNPEWQAWRFAGSILMPERPFRRLHRQGHSDNEMSEIFGVNPAFIRSRKKALNLRA